MFQWPLQHLSSHRPRGLTTVSAAFAPGDVIFLWWVDCSFYVGERTPLCLAISVFPGQSGLVMRIVFLYGL